MITAVLAGQLDGVCYHADSIFGLMMPQQCPGVPSEMLSAKYTWEDKNAYTRTAQRLAGYFAENFKQYQDKVSEEVLAAAPKT